MAVGVIDLLEVVEVEHHQPQVLVEALRPADLGVHDLLEAAMVEEAGQVVGDGLGGHQLVEVHVLQRNAGLAREIAEEVALGLGEGTAGPRHGDHPDHLVLSLRLDQRDRQRAAAVHGRLLGAPRAQGDRLGPVHGLGEIGQVPVRRPLVQPAVAAAQARPPAVGGQRVERGLDDDLQQSLAVEVGGERFADPPDRPLQANPLLAQLLEAGLELLGHLVELAAQGRAVTRVAGKDRAQAPIRINNEQRR